MNVTDPIADMLTRIRNATMVKHESVLIPYSNLKKSIAELLQEEGYISGHEVLDDGKFKELKITLKYTSDGSSVIKGLKRVSKPGRRMYINSKSLKPVLGGLGNGIVSTSKGLKSIKYCMRERLGGEYICQFW